MRIAHVANFYGPTSGGLRTAMHELGRGYTARGHSVLLVVPGAQDADEATEHGRRVTLASAVLPLSGGYRVISRTRELKSILKDFRPDVLEISDRTTLRGLGPWATRHGIPAVFFAHERADGILAAHLPPRLGASAAVGALADAHNRGTAKRFPTLVCTTDYAAQELRRIGAHPELVPLGVDLTTFHPSRYDDTVRAQLAAPDEHLLVMASRLSAEKRPDLAVDAVRHLAGRGVKVRLACLGTGAIEREIRALARGLPVDLLGFVSGRDRFAQLLAAADAVIAPGPIETFGLAALEALASGTPVVVNEASALPEVVGPAGVTAQGSPEAFADAIEELLGRPPQDRRATARARAEQMPWSRTVDAMLEIHGQVPEMAPARAS